MKKHRGHTGEAGFTLIELMVVIVILGLLAGILPRFMGESDRAKQQTAKMQIVGIETALKMYKLDNGSYPTTEQGHQALVEAPPRANFRKTGARGYLEKGKVPKDPGKMNLFMYVPEATETLILPVTVLTGNRVEKTGVDQDINNWEIE